MPIENTTPSRIMQFLWFCAGVNKRVLERCPSSEHGKMAGIGAAVLFTGILAALSGGYALYVAWQSVGLGMVFGVFWGLVIFNLDRFMVATLKRGDTFGRLLLPALPRVLLAIVLALVIAKPLELRIFQSEINEVLEDQKIAKLGEIEARFQERIAVKEQTILKKEARLEAFFDLRENYYQAYRCECDGTCGTGKQGRGSECERKEQRYLQSAQEYEMTKAKTEREITDIQNVIRELEAEGQTLQAKTEAVYSYGLVARLSASEQLPWAPRVFIPLLILLVELSPILAKLLAPSGPYEAGLAREEEAYRLKQEALLQQQRMEIEQEHQLQNHLSQAEMEEMVAQKKRAIQELSKAQLELTQQQIVQWMEQERKRMKGRDEN